MLRRPILRQLTDFLLLDRSSLISSFRCLTCRNPQFLDQKPSQWSTRPVRHASSSSSVRWKNRQGRDRFAREAKVQGLKSRAAFKLLEINEKYHIFKKGDTVVDLGYAPGSWSQVALNRTQPNGRVVGIDVIPAQPPKGVSTIQGNFLSPEIQAGVRAFLLDPMRGRARRKILYSANDDSTAANEELSEEELAEQERGYVDMERHFDDGSHNAVSSGGLESSSSAADKQTVCLGGEERKLSKKEKEQQEGRVVDVVLSDMSAPWDQTTGFWKRSVSDPYFRMMNTSGLAFRDHAGSMDLCMAALTFCFDTLRTGGHFVCKYYQGAEEKILEGRLKSLFEKVHREKPESSRSESKEAYFVALRRKHGVERDDILQAA